MKRADKLCEKTYFKEQIGCDRYEGENEATQIFGCHYSRRIDAFQRAIFA